MDMRRLDGKVLMVTGATRGIGLATARRLGGEVVLIERSERVLPREAEPLGEALGVVLRRDGIEVVLGASEIAQVAEVAS